METPGVLWGLFVFPFSRVFLSLSRREREDGNGNKHPNTWGSIFPFPFPFPFRSSRSRGNGNAQHEHERVMSVPGALPDDLPARSEPLQGGELGCMAAFPDAQQRRSAQAGLG